MSFLHLNTVRSRVHSQAALRWEMGEHSRSVTARDTKPQTRQAGSPGRACQNAHCYTQSLLQKSRRQSGRKLRSAPPHSPGGRPLLGAQREVLGDGDLFLHLRSQHRSVLTPLSDLCLHRHDFPTLTPCLPLMRNLLITWEPPKESRIVFPSQDPQFNHICKVLWP